MIRRVCHIVSESQTTRETDRRLSRKQFSMRLLLYFLHFWVKKTALFRLKHERSHYMLVAATVQFELSREIFSSRSGEEERSSFIIFKNVDLTSFVTMIKEYLVSSNSKFNSSLFN